jgi:hypothetical protein
LQVKHRQVAGFGESFGQRRLAAAARAFDQPSPTAFLNILH